MMLVSFSGLDGCGKSTQVAALCDVLARRGLRVYRMVPLYASLTGVATLYRQWRRSRRRAPEHSTRAASEPRAYAGRRTFTADRLTVASRLRRTVAYPLDCLALTSWIGGVRLCGYDVVVCDRYVFDKFVNLPSPAGWWARFLQCLVPRPDVAFFLDVGPEVASTRRTEHARDYYETKYAAYRAMIEAGFRLEPITQQAAEDVQRVVLEKVDRILARKKIVPRAHDDLDAPPDEPFELISRS
jgi:thymidylate kinase